MRKFVCILMMTAILVGCVGTIPKEALQLNEQSLERRQLQTRRFDSTEERKLLVAGSQVLQDMGFNMDESTTKLGVITASKDASAVNGGQVALAILVALGGGGSMPIDDKQKIRVSIVTQKKDAKSTNMRATFQRIVWNNQGQISKIEFVDDKDVYKEFFEKLSKSVFLTANEI